MKKELEQHEKGLEANIHLDLPRITLKKISNLKTPAAIDSVFKKSRSFTTDWSRN